MGGGYAYYVSGDVGYHVVYLKCMNKLLCLFQANITVIMLMVNKHINLLFKLVTCWQGFV